MLAKILSAQANASSVINMLADELLILFAGINKIP
jgi:hypothetical protein